MSALPDTHVTEVCRPGGGSATCSFLMRSMKGWECSKGTNMELIILNRREAGTLKSKGDNCGGPPDFAPITNALREFQGLMAVVTELPSDLPPREGMPEQVATLSHWFVSSPAAHPVWPHYLLLCVHLRDVPGQSRPPFRRFPGASHELMLIALNPEVGPWTAATVVERMYAPREKSAFLEPLNFCEQIAQATDAQAIELTALLARGIADGHVPIEPHDVYEGRAIQRSIIAKTYEHIRLGGHPENN